MHFLHILMFTLIKNVLKLYFLELLLIKIVTLMISFLSFHCFFLFAMEVSFNCTCTCIKLSHNKLQSGWYFGLNAGVTHKRLITMGHKLLCSSQGTRHSYMGYTATGHIFTN